MSSTDGWHCVQGDKQECGGLIGMASGMRATVRRCAAPGVEGVFVLLWDTSVGKKLIHHHPCKFFFSQYPNFGLPAW